MKTNRASGGRRVLPPGAERKEQARGAESGSRAQPRQQGFHPVDRGPLQGPSSFSPSGAVTAGTGVQGSQRAYVSRRVTYLELDHQALAGNVRAIRDRVGEAALCAVVKANAYGHGAVEVAKVALSQGASRLAVATVSEGVELRQAGISAPILVLGFTAPEEAEDLVRFELAATVISEESVAALDAAAQRQGKQALVHLKVNTGMNRLGVEPSEAVGLVEALSRFRSCALEGIFTHFHSADSDREATLAQLRAFQGVISQLEEKGLRPPLVHAANSDATLNYPQSHFDLVRVGTALYGLQAGFKPVLSWKSSVAHLNHLEPGETVSYGATYTAQGEREIAVVPVGWADGLAAGAGKWKELLVHGKRAPIVGAITMDQCMVDVTGLGPVKVGDPVVMLGAQGEEEITAEDANRWLGHSHPVAVTTNIRPRSPSRTLEADGAPWKSLSST